MVGATRSPARRDQGRVDLFTLIPQSGTKGTSDPALRDPELNLKTLS